jgi:hypothetical protein
MYFHPSIIAHTLNGGLFLVAVVLSLVYYKSLASLDIYRSILLILAFGIIAGIHGLSHLGLEYAYGYNPWTVSSVLPRQRQMPMPMTCPHMKSCPCRHRSEGFQMKVEGGPTCAIRGED